MTSEWLIEAEKILKEAVGNYYDLFYIISVGENSNQISFLQILWEAVKGKGVMVGNNVSYNLDQDWDEGDSFVEVRFFYGDLADSCMSIHDFVKSIDILSKIYIKHYPCEENEILSASLRVRERMLKFT